MNSLLQNRPTAKAMSNTGVDSLSEPSSELVDVSSLEQDGLCESEGTANYFEFWSETLVLFYFTALNTSTTPIEEASCSTDETNSVQRQPPRKRRRTNQPLDDDSFSKFVNIYNENCEKDRQLMKEMMTGIRRILLMVLLN
ncbi:uncharacterized protein LOC144745251 isoform X2 [Ciona intestinalis]